MMESATHAPIVMINGEHIALGPYVPDIKPLLAKWFNSLAISIPSGDISLPLTPEAIDAEYERCTKSGDRVDFII